MQITQTSQEMVFHPAMGIGLTAGRLEADATQAARKTDTRKRDDRPSRDRRTRAQDCAYIFQCA
jgi:hypothetical protein